MKVRLSARDHASTLFDLEIAVMLARALAGAALIILALAAPAAAISITNLDDKDYKITVVEGDKQTDHQLKASQVLEGVCLKGCTIVIDDGEDQYSVKEGEAPGVVIQEGELYYDGPEPGEQTGAQQGDQKGTPKGAAPPPAPPAPAPQPQAPPKADEPKK